MLVKRPNPIYPKSAFVFLLLLFSSCANLQKKGIPEIEYKSLFLKSALNEISGLQYFDSTTLLGIQDENGIIYYINSLTGEIKGSTKFNKNGDFEGVATKDSIVYILRSDGTVFKYNGNKTSKCIFPSKKKFEFEGLCLGKNAQKLYVALKKPNKKIKQDRIYIYQIDLDSFEYKKEPLFKLNKKQFKVSNHFHPSGISLDTNKNIVLLSSHSHELLVVSPNGEFVKSTALNKAIFAQPEGITFAPNGTMYVSNEKKSRGPNILIFNSLESVFK